ncbi:hypothetical protein OIDMADRAFT_196955 [Oidiodendron maius Zn]|uniref:proline--tRNA ligase n=1 Tax=Oidiodendron maius (strain Zn) TaxID=913774 RepID=A0A0C3CSS0_OIDMZ|nr:hypothetical protein OIDMADRAFT_196955 [Oidiodendron maius Zn]
MTASSTDAHSTLIRAGFIRSAHSGLYHMLPLGRRVQDKLEALIDTHMSSLVGASKVALSSISSEELWTKSGRLNRVGSEIFRFKDRKDVGYLLSPTHEEEITNLVLNSTKSYRDLPLRLYQISRKYRDELRPRQGLLRSREFIMKDLYTFDYNIASALETYRQVRQVYADIFDELKMPYLVADADSGDMGGNLSHEFHFPTPNGEDNIISCTSCDYVANEELAENVAPTTNESGKMMSDSRTVLQPKVWRGVSRDRNTLVNVWYPPSSSSSDRAEINLHAVKSALPDFDASVEDPLAFWAQSSSAVAQNKSLQIVNLIDHRLSRLLRQEIELQSPQLAFWPKQLNDPPSGIAMEALSRDLITQRPLDLLRIKDGDPCARCASGTLRVQKAIEMGHTFYLGTRYSDPLNATVTVPRHLLQDADLDSNTTIEHEDLTLEQKVPMQMGCYGIGISRMIAAVADNLADEKGLNWPRVMAPFEVVVVPARGLDDAACEVYDVLSSHHQPRLDIVLDDRAESFPWKMRDADLVGYPVIIVAGRRWKDERVCEVQCRRLNVREERHLDQLPAFVESLLNKL